jgi:hypothetical protein
MSSSIQVRSLLPQIMAWPAMAHRWPTPAEPAEMEELDVEF